MMPTVLPAPDTSGQGLVTIRALSSITSQQAKMIAQAVHASGSAWDVQTMVDYDGYLSILIEPSLSDDQRNSFFISGVAQRLELLETDDDEVSALGSFSDVQALSAQLLNLIAQQ